MVGGKKESAGRTRIVAQGERQARVGDVIKQRFELIELLGEGGMGKVFKALDRVRRDAQDREPYVALKVLSPAFSRHQASTIALQRETKKALSLTHGNVIRVYDFDRDKDMVFMTMELLSGRSLEAVLREPGFSGMPLERALQIIRPAAAALAHAHESGFVHSDFKPSNVFLTDGGRVKVIDLGIARAVKRADAAGDQTVFDPAELHAVTLPYASPEQIEGREPDPRDDVYALACVTYELLTGTHPFDRMSSVGAMMEGKQAAKPASLDKRQWAALKRALAFQRSERTPSIEEFMQGFALPAKAAALPFWALLAAGGAGLAAAASIAAWLLWPSPAPPLPPPTGAEIGQTPPIETPDTPHPPASPGASPPEPPPARAEARLEGIQRLVRAVPCALLQVEVSQGIVRLEGSARSEVDAASLTRELQAQPGIASVLHSLSMVNDAACPPIDLARPFVFAAWDTASPLAVRPTKPVFETGDSLVLEIVGDTQGGYVTVDYYDGYGSIVHMLPRPGAADSYLKADARLRLGTGGKNGEWEVGPPYGRDLVVLIKTPAPLFERPRKKEVESAADYLPELRGRLDRLAGRPGAGPILASYALVTTQPR